ncbi:hypothetical protein CONPUDRAFT_166869 [Coniophora puteana RWD-64-598 SS2]|uniref:Uncharacterized protein n=1 Tax=Coniophora puteana (strain RWD-64-598) TaxID=741705 RepID=A0A5M3MIU0_CONPW|nr:uncharacterized protein CONPUDRAFT_166869 [Coniophora puteana RWD-64-598 SS2]EIW79033.1 hypothetical protein CONPUDRAFT_166869 [Coniophora puteana RWD-64-598 SS2]
MIFQKEILRVFAMNSDGYIPKKFWKYAIVRWPPSHSNYGGYLPTSPPTIPPQDATDHVSGNTYVPDPSTSSHPAPRLIRVNSFFIRSRADPRDFWHIPSRGPHAATLLVSRTDRTRFRITTKDAPAPLNGGPTIMIGSDVIEIAAAKTGGVVGIDSRGYLALGAPASARVGAMTQLVVEERAEASEQLVVEERGDDMGEPAVGTMPEGNQETSIQILFKDLKARLSVSSEDGDRSVARRLEVGDGEEWELV